MEKNWWALRRCKHISRGHLLQEFFKIPDGILMSEFLNNSDQRNQMALELFHNSFIIPLHCAPLTKFWPEKLTNKKEYTTWSFCFFLSLLFFNFGGTIWNFVSGVDGSGNPRNFVPTTKAGGFAYCWFQVKTIVELILRIQFFWKKEYDYFRYVILAHNFVFLGHT